MVKSKDLTPSLGRHLPGDLRNCQAVIVYQRLRDFRSHSEQFVAAIDRSLKPAL